ncbi:hypothetical protein AgCh_037830 [Apium graveolens]
MSWEWKQEYLDRLLVPIGLLIMFTYHALLFNRYRKDPLTTLLGSEDYYKKIWAEKTLQIRSSPFCEKEKFQSAENYCRKLDAKDRGTSVSVISSNIAAANTLSSVSLVLSSLIGAWIGSSNYKNIFVSSIIYGDSSSTIASIKYVALLSCFLISFAAFIQTTRHYALATFLITIPSCDIPVLYVQKPILKASHSHMVGMRALYTAGTLIMWIFGPIPMIVSTVCLVAVLHFLDRNLTPPYKFQQLLNRIPFHKIGGELASVTMGLR